MRIKKLELKNFRGFEELTIDFPEGEGGLAVFVGVNGSGKTSVLDAIIDFLNGFTSKLTKENRSQTKGVSPNAPFISSDDVKNGESQGQTIILFEYLNEIIKDYWKIYSDGGRMKMSGRFNDEIFNRIKNKLFSSMWLDSPIMAFYPTDRFVAKPKLKVVDLKNYKSYRVYDNALNSSIDFESFFDWFRSKEDLENQKRLNLDNSYRDVALDAVRSAINNFIDYFQNPRVERDFPERLVIEKGNELLSFQKLSHGERLIIAMVGDIAKRLSTVCLGNPLAGKGVVLIDEIEQHLHPSWQRTIIPNLRRTFPNIQFIVTTHSPQVLSNVPRENVFILQDFKLEKQKPHTEGRDSNAILEDIFGVPSRPENWKGQLHELFDAIEKGEKGTAQKLYTELKNKLGDRDLELQRAENFMDVLIG